MTDIGRKSDSIEAGGWLFGMGTTLECFHWLGIQHCLNDELTIEQIGAAKMSANSTIKALLKTGSLVAFLV